MRGLESRSRTSRSRSWLLWQSLGLEIWARSRSRGYGLDYITVEKRQYYEACYDYDWDSRSSDNV